VRRRAAIVAATNEVAARHFGAADTSADGRGNAREPEVERRRVERRLLRGQVCALLVERAHAPVEFVARHRPCVGQLLYAAGLDLGEVQLRPR
jgi:hypothetical protein